MKNIIVTVAEILLGVVLFLAVFGNANSLRTEGNRFMGEVRTEMADVSSD